MGKLLVIASVVISLATAGLGFVNKGALGKTKEDLAASEAAKTAAETKATAAAKDLKTKSDELTTAQAAQAQAEAAAASAKTELATAKTALDAATSKAADAETQIATLNNQVKELNDKISAAPVGGATNNDASAQIAELTTQLQEKETLVAKLQSELDNSKGIQKGLQAKIDQKTQVLLKKGTEGRILAVNPAWNFVVLNLGDKQNVSNNTELLVKRGTRFLGKVRITSVEPSTSIADIVVNSMPQGATISPGDTVIFQGSGEE